MSDRERREFFVYRVFDAAGRLLYVGCTNRPRKRWTEHGSARRGMVKQAVRFRVQGPFTREVARNIEREALHTEEPVYGWTPAKRREKRLRDLWIDERMAFHTGAGLSWPEALHRACADARELFPNPVEHEYSEVPA